MFSRVYTLKFTDYCRVWKQIQGRAETHLYLDMSGTPFVHVKTNDTDIARDIDILLFAERIMSL